MRHFTRLRRGNKLLSHYTVVTCLRTNARVKSRKTTLTRQKTLHSELISVKIDHVVKREYVWGGGGLNSKVLELHKSSVTASLKGYVFDSTQSIKVLRDIKGKRVHTLQYRVTRHRRHLHGGVIFILL